MNAPTVTDSLADSLVAKITTAWPVPAAATKVSITTWLDHGGKRVKTGARSGDGPYIPLFDAALDPCAGDWRTAARRQHARAVSMIDCGVIRPEDAADPDTRENLTVFLALFAAATT